jgi:hypothetical protein
MGAFNIFPNLYIVYVANAGWRKSTSMRQGKRFLKKIGAPLAAEATSREKLIEDMQDRPVSIKLEGAEPIVYTPLTACVSEMSNFFGTSLHQMTDFLTDIFDEEEEYEYRTKNRKSYVIKRPYFVLMGCTTPSWINSRLKDDVISGGFSRRALFVFNGDPIRRIPRPMPSECQQESMKWCWTYAQNVLKKVKGEFKWTDSAIAFHDDWYMNRLEIPDDPVLGGYYASKQIQVLKIAMCISLAESKSLVVDKHHIEDALSTLGQIEPFLPRVFESLGRNDLNAVANQAHDIVKRRGGWIKEKKLMSALYREAKGSEIEEIIQVLVNTERVLRKAVDIGGFVSNWIIIPDKWNEFQNWINNKSN